MAKDGFVLEEPIMNGKSFYFLKLKIDLRNTVLTGKSGYVNPMEIEAPPPNWRKVWENTFIKYPERPAMKFPLETGRSIIEFKPDKLASEISPRALLILSNRNDTVVPPAEQSSIFDKAQEPKKFIKHGRRGACSLRSAKL